MRKMSSVEKEIRDDTYFNVTSLNPAATRIIHSELLPVMRNGISPGPLSLTSLRLVWTFF